MSTDDLLDHFKIEAEITPECTTHVSYRPNLDGGARERIEEKWTRMEVIGEGAFGEVWREAHEQQQLGKNPRVRAVKCIPKRRMEAWNVDFKKELLAMAKFSKEKHRQEEVLVQFYAWFENSRSIFLAMEYLEHGDLAQHINIISTEEEVRQITNNLLDGLKIMHGEGFAHRDLKPQNIFVVKRPPQARRWWVKIGDFGISKRVKNEDTVLRTQTGTPYFQAPEIQGLIDDESESSAYSMAVDMWSLGIVVYNLGAKRVPFQNLSETLRFCRGITTIPKEPLQPILSDAAIDFITRLLVPQPKQRMSAEDALQDAWVLSPVENGPEINLSATTSSPGTGDDISSMTITPSIQSPKSRDSWFSESDLSPTPFRVVSKSPSNQAASTDARIPPLPPRPVSPNNEAALSDRRILPLPTHQPFSSDNPYQKLDKLTPQPFQEFGDTVNASTTTPKFFSDDDFDSHFFKHRDISPSMAGLSLGAKPAPPESKQQINPSIYFKPYRDPNDRRPSLEFKPLVRVVNPGAIISMGRYKEGIHNVQWNVHPNAPLNLPVGFKSKVVSRIHCEFWFDSSHSQWYMRDVKSSSGTFLTSPPDGRVRLSAAGIESSAYPVMDGDIVQLGVDFRGGEEVIYRSVKIKIECHGALDEDLHRLNMVANNIDPG